jgi:hypothetical protein
MYSHWHLGAGTREAALFAYWKHLSLRSLLAHIDTCSHIIHSLSYKALLSNIQKQHFGNNVDAKDSTLGTTTNQYYPSVTDAS